MSNKGNKITSKIAQFLFLSKEDYRLSEKGIIHENTISLRLFSVLSFFPFLIMFIISFSDDYALSSRWLYFGMAIAVLIVAGLSFFAVEKNRILLRAIVYVFMSIILFYGVATGTIFAPDKPTVSFVVLLFVLPLLFVDKPLYINLVILVWCVVYCILAYFKQTREMFMYNIVDVVIYGLLSMATSAFIGRLRFQRAILVERNRILIETDQLTGLKNRHSYVEYLKTLDASKDVAIVALDLDGLKTVNDTLGHQAGDDYLIACAETIKEVFESFGPCYRIGGDEFAVIIDGKKINAVEMIAKLDEACTNKSIDGALPLSISCGIATNDDSPDLNVLLRLADQRMYEAKEKHYVDSGIDRRKR